MEAIFRLKGQEIDTKFLESIRKLFVGKDVIIRITTEMDETEYLTLYPANEDHILQNMAAEPVKRFTGDEFSDYVSKLQ